MTEKEIKIANKIINQAKRKILLTSRYMTKSIDYLCKNIEFTYLAAIIGTDGKNLFVNPKDIIKLYEGGDNLLRYFLHMAIHCYYGQFLKKKDCPDDIYNASCDIFVEYIIDNRFDEYFENGKMYQREKIYDAMIELGCKFTLSDIILMLTNFSVDFSTSKIMEVFTLDDHNFWRVDEGADEQFDEEDLGDFFDFDSNLDIEISDEAEENNKKDNKQKNRLQIEREQSEEELSWKELFMQCKVDKKKRSDRVKGAKIFDEEKEKSGIIVDYKTLLRDFLQFKEIQKENIEEYDLGFYSYGLKLFGNVPLIESLETSNVKELSKIVIALDTSRSIERETIVKFLIETTSIIKETVTDKNLSVMIIQADDHINEVKEISTKEQLEDYVIMFDYKGGGATDFTVVFDKIAELQRAGNKIDGLIYLTDGEGIYPERPPDYKTAFLFLEGIGQQSFVPAWAEKIIISEKDYDKH